PAVALQRDLAVLQDQQPHCAAAGHVVAEAAADLAQVEGQVRERTGVRWEGPHRLAATDDAGRPPLLVADRRRLVLGCRGHGAPPLRRRQMARGRRRLTKQVMLVRIGLVAQARSDGWGAAPGQYGGCCRPGRNTIAAALAGRAAYERYNGLNEHTPPTAFRHKPSGIGSRAAAPPSGFEGLQPSARGR